MNIGYIYHFVFFTGLSFDICEGALYYVLRGYPREIAIDRLITPILSPHHFQGDYMQQVWSFLAGALLCNCVPHLASGLQGFPFPTPFAKPGGVGDSSPVVNVVWGFANLAVGVLIAARHTNMADIGVDALAGLVGALAIGTFMALHFGKVQRDKRVR
ncbi:hypothetical protein [Paraburkholderia bryophila]|uniref:hypothetical protein n=1 Tax=Paraburkholderia bryophila TaxID=420952 RepID=UPI0027B8FE85|nr:hypothetical protein [Paraburkholderia bryophila]